jgi:endoglycosylceramidase
MSRLDATIALLARYGIYSLLDMHQDVYNEAFGGEGAPNWAVCTDGVTPKPVRGVANWSVNYTGPGVTTAYGHFFTNDVVGDLQGELDSVWARIAAKERGDPWVIGYDPFNEPYGPGLNSQPNNPAFDAELECFYTGRAHPGLDQNGNPVTCPADDPQEGLIPRIEAADPTHLVAYEGNYDTDSGVPNHIGSMDFPRLVLNFHDYCFLHVPNGPEPSDFTSVCTPYEEYAFTQHAQERSNDASAAQPGGPAELLTEFGATTDTADLGRITADADANLVGWIYWQWINYDNDPTSSHASALWPPRAATSSQLAVLSQTYATAVAGVPTSMSFDPATGAFSLEYRADKAVTAPTVIVVPVSTHYPKGYCAKASGGRITSGSGSSRLDVANGSAAVVTVTLTAGRC